MANQPNFLDRDVLRLNNHKAIDDLKELVGDQMDDPFSLV